jgi:hypothetical protein
MAKSSGPLLSVERLVVVRWGLFLQWTDVATAQVLFRLRLSPLEQPVHPDKPFYAFEHDIFPLCHCQLKESHRHKFGGFWPADCEPAHGRRV